MAKQTTYYSLIKPEQLEFYNIDIINKNSDIIDTQLFNNQKNLEDTALATANLTLEVVETPSEGVSTTHNLKNNIINLITPEVQNKLEEIDIPALVSTEVINADIPNQVAEATQNINTTIANIQEDIQNLQQTDVSDTLKQVQEIEQNIFNTYYKYLFIDCILTYPSSMNGLTVRVDGVYKEVTQYKFNINFTAANTGGGVIFTPTGEEIVFTEEEAKNGLSKEIIIPSHSGDYLIRFLINNSQGTLNRIYIPTSSYDIKVAVDNSENWSSYMLSYSSYKPTLGYRIYSGVKELNFSSSSNPFTGSSITSLCFYSTNLISLPNQTGSNTALKELYLSNSITTLGTKCFYSATVPYQLYLPINLETVGNQCFYQFKQNTPSDFGNSSYVYFGYTSKLINKGTNCFTKGNQPYLDVWCIKEDNQTIKPSPKGWFTNFSSVHVTMKDDLSYFNQDIDKKIVTYAPAEYYNSMIPINQQIESLRESTLALSSQIQNLQSQLEDTEILKEGLKMLLGPSAYPYSSIIKFISNGQDSFITLPVLSDEYILGLVQVGSTLNYYIDFSVQQEFFIKTGEDLIIYNNILEYPQEAFKKLSFKEIDLTHKILTENEIGLFLENLVLKQVTLNEQNQILPNSIFNNCQSLTTIKNTKQLKQIGDFALQGTAVTYLELEKIDSIGESAFADISNNLLIQYTGTEEEWNDIYKGDNWNNNTHITVHLSSIDSEGTIIESEIEYNPS